MILFPERSELRSRERGVKCWQLAGGATRFCMLEKVKNAVRRGCDAVRPRREWQKAESLQEQLRSIQRVPKNSK